MKNTQRPEVSFVIPFFNEGKCVQAVYDRICAVNKAAGGSFELVCIDDDSCDDTLACLKQLRSADPRVRIVSFSRNFGHQIAVTAGLRYACGDCVVVMDGDLQDPPEVVPDMIRKWKEGYDVVYGVRRNRKEHFLKKFCYDIFYRILEGISPLAIPLDAGDFCLMSRRVVKSMCQLDEQRPFVRGLRAWVGFKQAGVEYDRDVRKAGDSKYSIMKLFSLAFDGALSFSVNALRVATVVGLIVSCVSIIYAVYIGSGRILIALGYMSPDHLVPGWTTLVCGMMFLIGLQFVFLGILGEYVGRIFMEVKHRPLYVVKEEVGFDHAA